MRWPWSCLEAATDRLLDRRSNKINFPRIAVDLWSEDARPFTQRMIRTVARKTSRIDVTAQPRLETLTAGPAYPPRS